MPVVDTTQSFATGDTVTSTTLNNIMDQSIFVAGAVVSGSGLDITAGGQMTISDNGLPGGKITNGTITGGVSGKIANDTITDLNVSASAAISPSKLGSGALTATATITTANIIDASITAPKLNGAQTGTAPIYGVRAWVNFDGTTANNIGGTYSRTLTTVTVTTSVDHGLIIGHKVFLDFTSGAATDGAFVVTGVTSNTIFTVTHGTSGSTSGNVTLNRRLIRASGNVANVSTLGTGQFAVNFTTAFPDANYARSGFANYISTAAAGLVSGNSTSSTTAQSCDILTADSSNGSINNFTLVNAMFVG